ncbi:MAG TPA: hypothetical protein VEA80_11685 [Vitreimonas sp.]|uniref:hypothetical protein n=1 Tax=Vitreimonas sp. TaxID=3069702 RepID=UPI002D5EA3F5|nr:hypothetical protein [Vitreimonas sp.]HYD88130.1 hypothetical protein [Vitreimonas sp.]
MTHWLEKVVLLLTADTTDVRKLAELAGGNPKTFYRGIRRADLELEGQNVDGMEFEDEIDASPRFTETDRAAFARYVFTASPKEERVAFLLRALLSFSTDTDAVLASYSTATMFEERAAAAFRTVLRSSSKRRAEQTEMIIARVGDPYAEAVLAPATGSLFTHLVASSRGKFMLALAKHVGNVPSFRNLIETKLDQTYSHHLLDHEAAIRQALAAH